MTKEQTDNIIRMAWCDRTSFETIQEKTGLSEAAVIKVMRAELKRKSFHNWRARVSGRRTKHRKRFRAERKRLRNHPPAP
jgi:uncharacterized protein (TIGR03643 family)